MAPFLYAALLLVLLFGQNASAATPPSVAVAAHWYPIEAYQGATFRWVDNDAEILVGGGGETTIDVDCEAGPGIGSNSFLLRVLDKDHHQVDAVQVTGRQTVQVFVPSGGRYVLHTDVGGKRIPNDKRILNFRVFALRAEPNGQSSVIGDVAGPNVTIGADWGVPEFYNNELFRWVANDATLTVRAPRDGRGMLQLLVERGPGMGNNPLRLTVTDSHGHATPLPPVSGRAALATPLTFDSGANHLRLHVAGGGAHISGDPRILNFRVFSVRAVVH